MNYEGWVGLTSKQRKAKSAPFKEAIQDMWKRLKRAYPEMQTAAKPFVKKKWDERAYFLVQDD